MILMNRSSICRHKTNERNKNRTQAGGNESAEGTRKGGCNPPFPSILILSAIIPRAKRGVLWHKNPIPTPFVTFLAVLKSGQKVVWVGIGKMY